MSDLLLQPPHHSLKFAGHLAREGAKLGGQEGAGVSYSCYWVLGVGREELDQEAGGSRRKQKIAGAPYLLWPASEDELAVGSLIARSVLDLNEVLVVRDGFVFWQLEQTNQGWGTVEGEDEAGAAGKSEIAEAE